MQNTIWFSNKFQSRIRKYKNTWSLALAMLLSWYASWQLVVNDEMTVQPGAQIHVQWWVQFKQNAHVHGWWKLHIRWDVSTEIANPIDNAHIVFDGAVQHIFSDVDTLDLSKVTVASIQELILQTNLNVADTLRLVSPEVKVYLANKNLNLGETWYLEWENHQRYILDYPWWTGKVLTSQWIDPAQYNYPGNLRFGIRPYLWPNPDYSAWWPVRMDVERSHQSPVQWIANILYKVSAFDQEGDAITFPESRVTIVRLPHEAPWPLSFRRIAANYDNTLSDVSDWEILFSAFPGFAQPYMPISLARTFEFWPNTYFSLINTHNSSWFASNPSFTAMLQQMVDIYDIEQMEAWIESQLVWEQYKNKPIIAYPNPTRDIVYFWSDPYRLEVSDIAGNHINTIVDNTYDFSWLARGIYIVKVIDPSTNIHFSTHKIVRN